MKLYDKRIIDAKANHWISYEINNGQEYFTVYNNIFSMIFDLFWKRNRLISMNIVDEVITRHPELLSSMLDNINLNYLETCYNLKDERRK